MPKSEIFISVDVEADGRIPGLNSMLSLGSVAFRIGESGYEQVSTFETNLLEMVGAIRNHEVMEWWEKFPEAWEKCRTNPVHPDLAMGRYLDWLKSLGSPLPLAFVGYPASYDFMFVYWYLENFTGERPFGHSALCIRTYAMAVLKHRAWINFERKKIPVEFQSNHPHDHTPLNDAIEQAQMFAALYQENTRESF